MSRPGRNRAIEAHGDFQLHPGAPELHGPEERRVLEARLAPAHAGGHLDAPAAQVRETTTSHLRKRVARRHDHTADARIGHGHRAWTGAPGVTARLERAVERCSARANTRGLQRDDLGVRPTSDLVMSDAEDDAFIVHDDCADDGIGCRAGAPAFGMPERAGHETGVLRVERPVDVAKVYHASSKSASTYSRGLNGTRSSICSPVPT